MVRPSAVRFRPGAIGRQVMDEDWISRNGNDAVVPPLRCVIVPRDSAPGAEEGFVLAEVVLAEPSSGQNSEGPLVVHWPLGSLDESPKVERWLTCDEPATEWSSDGVVAVAGGAMFGQIVASRQTAGDVEASTREMYARMFHLIETRECPHLARLWVSIPRINEKENGLERYKAFCRGRADAFERHYGEGFERGLSSSTAVGSRGGLATLNFLSLRLPSEHFDNPRQMSAYRYPREYGPRSPSFARATALPGELGGAFLISGTSSVTGHASRHRGDVRKQVWETLRNLDILFAGEAKRLGKWHGIEPTCIKVYLRDPEDLDMARACVEAWFPNQNATSFLHADICRSELLVEIEAVGEPV